MTPTFNPAPFSVRLSILDMLPSYRFSGDPMMPDERLSESLVLEVKGKCVDTPGFDGRELIGHIMGGRDLLPRPKIDKTLDAPLSIGDLHLSPKSASFHCMLPFDVLAPLHGFFRQGSIQLMTLWGTALQRGKAPIFRIGFTPEVHLDGR